jgi:DNA polymerase-1
MPESQISFLNDTLISDRLNYVSKTKNIAWLFTSKLFCVNTEAELRDFVKRATASKGPKAIDTETTGLMIGVDSLVGISVAWLDEEGQPMSFYVPLISDVDKVGIAPTLTLCILQPLLEQPGVYCNFKFDYQFLKSVGIEAKCLADISLMRQFPRGGLDERQFLKNKKTSLKDDFRNKFGLDMLELEDILGKGIHNFALAPLELGRIYAATDSYATLLLYQFYLKDLNDDIIYKMENKLLPIVAEMEYRGVKIDGEALKKAKDVITAENKELEAKIYELAGVRFKITSSQQLADVLFTKLGLPPGEMTSEDSDTPSTDKFALAKLEHPIIPLIQKYKKNSTLITSFLIKLPTKLDASGHVHTHLNPYGAITGRFTCSNPNLQQIPKAKEDGENSEVIRRSFIADEGYYLISCDYSMIEYRVMASLCKDEKLIKLFNEGIDIHAGTASIMFKIPLDKVTKDMRSKGKTINFGLLFGMGAYRLSKNLKCSEEEANVLLEAYFEAIPGVKPWIENIKAKVRETKMCSTYFGRVRRLPDAGLPNIKENRQAIGEALRQGTNTTIQGSAAEFLKISMIRLQDALKGKDMHMILQIHDELLFLVNKNVLIDDAVSLIKGCMELKIEGFVPIVADPAIGYSWGEMVDYTPGMTLNDIPFYGDLTISEDKNTFEKCGEELKKIFGEFRGNQQVFIDIGNKTIQPQEVDNETGEIMDVKVSTSPTLLSKIKELGLMVKTG